MIALKCILMFIVFALIGVGSIIGADNLLDGRK